MQQMLVEYDRQVVETALVTDATDSYLTLASILLVHSLPSLSFFVLC
jgi:hypothetical protein